MLNTPICKTGVSETSDTWKNRNTRIPVWNNLEERVIVGEEAPTRRNLLRYLKIYRFCDLYIGQDNFSSQRSIDRIITSMGLDPDEHVTMWNSRTNEIMRGDNAPTRAQLPHFLKHNPDYEEFAPWEARVTKKVIIARNRWLEKVRGTSYIAVDMPKPSASDADDVITIDLTQKPVYW